MTCFVSPAAKNMLFIILIISTLNSIDGRFCVLVSYCEEKKYSTFVKYSQNSGSKTELVATGMGELESVKT
jgi:hypothetical protein